ncbi:MAG: DUF3365 domain-containing protein [Pseudomonadota bacterium]
MGLRLKFNIVLVLACLVGMGVATFLTYKVAQDSALEEIEQEIALIRSKALAVRHYTVTGVQPMMQQNSDILFLPHTVPSFAAQAVFARFQETNPQYDYKEAALNPTNPDDLAEPWEAELIETLRADPALDRVTTVRTTDAGSFYTVAFPFTIRNEGCLVCHSTPEAAPAAMIDLYGPENGFGWQLNETIGAMIISAPMTLAAERAKEQVLVLIAALGSAFLLVLLITNLLLSRIVIRPVVAMSQIAEQVSLGDFSLPEYVKPGRDEISSLSTSFNRMRRSLDSAMRILDDG